VTHDRPKTGSLIWIAEPTFDDPPTVPQVQAITTWRWPVFFHLAAALRRQIVNAVGMIDLPPGLRSFPVLRSGNRSSGWQTFTEDENGERQQLGPATDARTPVYLVVNDTRLREMIVSGWRPQDA
jgi:hypothetical protein